MKKWISLAIYNENNRNIAKELHDFDTKIQAEYKLGDLKLNHPKAILKVFENGMI